MSFCTACGCERTGANHYCDGCGAEFGEAARRDGLGRARDDRLRPGNHVSVSGSGTGGWAAPWPSGAVASEPASSASTRPDLGVGLLDSLFTAPDPGGGTWPGQAAAGERAERGPGPRAPGPRHWAAIVAAAVVIIAGLGGAAAFELGHGHGRPGAVAARDRVAAAPSTAPRPAPSAAAGNRGTGVAAGNRGTGVAVASGVASAGAGNAALPRVIALLDRYFSAINQHDYAAYASLLDPQLLQRTSASAFYSGDGSTTDSGATLTGLSDTNAGGVAAAVTFTSRQQPADSPDHSACDDWSITLYLVPQGSGYLIGLPLAGYQASYTSC
jgi:hypothetical protein